MEEGKGGLVDVTDSESALKPGEAVRIVKGSQFAMEDFRPVKELGTGDMGSVFLVAQRSDNAPYAMKVMRKDVLRARKNKYRAERERGILSLLNHPFLPVLHSHFEDQKRTFLVMNYCHGGDLNSLRHRQPEKRFSESACRFYAAEVLLALDYLHKRSIVYRDLKPENILIQSSGHIILTDFDLSVDLSTRKGWKSAVDPKVCSSSSSLREKSDKILKVSHVKAFFACGSPRALARKLSETSLNARVSPEESHSSRKRGPAKSFVGTEEYVAPEMLWRRGHGLPVDWWALGVLLYELHYGKTPFKGENKQETFYNVLRGHVAFPAGSSSSLTELIRKLLTKEPEERLGTKGGAEEIKMHPFFKGVNWDELEYVSRTPAVPEPFSWERIEADLDAKAKLRGTQVHTKWLICESSQSPLEVREDNSTAERAKSIGTMLQKSNDSLYRNRLVDSDIAQSLNSRSDSPRAYISGEFCTSEDTFSLNAESPISKEFTSIFRKEEVRLDENFLAERILFEDFF